MILWLHLISHLLISIHSTLSDTGVWWGLCVFLSDSLEWMMLHFIVYQLVQDLAPWMQKSGSPAALCREITPDKLRFACHSLPEILLIYERKCKNKNTSQAVKIGCCRRKKTLHSDIRQIFKRFLGIAALAVNALGHLCSGEYVLLTYSWGIFHLHTS